MTEPLDELYLTWLYRQVGNVKLKNPSRTHWTLLRQLYTKEFVWLIPNDDNRVEDGRDLRYEFISDEGIDIIDQDWMELGCSFLEMMIGLCRRLSFEGEGEPALWFWRLLENLQLQIYNDRVMYDVDIVDHIMDTVIFRTYKPDGQGGLFPLNRADRDQTDVELWYQMSAYLLERT